MTTLGQVALIGLVIVSAWFFGGVQASVQAWLFVAGVLGLSCALAKQWLDHDRAASVPTAMVPLIFMLGLGGLQLLPVDPKVGAVLSPGGTQFRETFQSETTASDTALASTFELAELPARQPLSVYPASTRHDLALLTLAVVVFLAGAILFGTQQAALWLCGLVAVHGGAMAFFGLVQKLTWNGLLFWTVPLTQGGGPFASFVNRNNGAGYLNLCLACALGLAVWVTGRGMADSYHSALYPRSKERLWVRVWRGLLDRIGDLDGPTIAAVSLVICIVAGVLCSLSRGAAVAMVGAGFITLLAVLVTRRRRGFVRGWWIAIAGTGGLALVFWVGMQGSMFARLATLLDHEKAGQSRVFHWQDGVKAVPDFWTTGSGLGTYRYVYGPHQQRTSSVWFYHAENQYIERLVESGVIGLGLAIVAIGFVTASCWRLLRDVSDARSFAMGVAGVFTLSSQAIHACFDFGLSIPANMLLFALLCGVLSGGACNLAGRKGSRRILMLPVGRWLATPMTVTLLAAGAWGFFETQRVKVVETATARARFDETPQAATSEEIETAIRQMEAAVSGRPDDAEAHARLAQLWTHLYRLRALDWLQSAAIVEEDENVLWERTSPVEVHGLGHHFARYDDSHARLDAFRKQQLARTCLVPALRHLVLSRRACPLLPRVHARLAELSVFGAEPNDDQIHMDRAKQLAASHPGLLFRCGLLEFQAGRLDLASESWRKSLSLSPRYLDQVLKYGGQQISYWHLIDAVLPESPELLLELATDRYPVHEHQAVHRMLVARAELLLEEQDLPEDQKHYLQGRVFAIKGEYGEAIESYQRALAKNWERNDWRYDLALALKEAGRMDEAHKEAVWCTRMEPNNRGYRALLVEVNRARLTEKTVLE